MLEELRDVLSTVSSVMKCVCNSDDQSLEGTLRADDAMRSSKLFQL